ncbi:MAG: alpha/beta hydrolase-fold protein [Verrucomicrobiota bacterium]
MAGISLSGLASAYLTLTRPTVFSHCLSHSGSFWWNDEWLTMHLGDIDKSQGALGSASAMKRRRRGFRILRRDCARRWRKYRLASGSPER